MIDMEIVGGISAIAFIIGLLEFLQKLGLNKSIFLLSRSPLDYFTSIGYYYYGNTTWFEAIVIGIMSAFARQAFVTAPGKWWMLFAAEVNNDIPVTGLNRCSP